MLNSDQYVEFGSICCNDVTMVSVYLSTTQTSPTASGKGLRRLAQCVWMAGCDCGVVVFFGFSCDVEHVLAKIPIVDSSCGHTKSSPIGVG